MLRRPFPAPAKEPGDAGFTLIEMLVVVSIIGVLAAVAIPRYMAYAKSSKSAEVANTAGALVAAMTAYGDGQGLSPSGMVTKFGSAVLNYDTPGGAGDLTTLIPTFTAPANSKFNYAISAAVAGTGATGGPQAGDTVYCIQATARANSGLTTGGTVVFSSAPSAAANWDGRLNRQFFDSATFSTITVGGYCAAAGTASVTYAP